MKTKGIASRFLKISLACLASPSCQPYRLCDPVDDAAVGELPERLSATGLFAGQEAESLAPDVRSFRPRFELWSDGASKRRWIWLPPGTRIDSSDMDAWQFPVGTKLWKEFTRDAVRVETRLLERRPSGWIGLAYLWQNEGRDATAAPFGAIAAQLKRDQWLVVGMETHVCVYQTARDLAARGFATHVVADAVASRTKANWRIGLDLAERAGALITSTEVCVFDLLERAGTEEFKTLSKAIR